MRQGRWPARLIRQVTPDGPVHAFGHGIRRLSSGEVSRRRLRVVAAGLDIWRRVAGRLAAQQNSSGKDCSAEHNEHGDDGRRDDRSETGQTTLLLAHRRYRLRDVGRLGQRDDIGLRGPAWRW